MRLNIGCGPLLKKGYINIDGYDENADVKAQADKLPYDNNSVDEIISYHLVEHLDPHRVHTSLLPEWLRVLKPGGKVVIEIPDLKRCFKEYEKADKGLKYSILSGVYGVENGPMRHQFGWCYELLSDVFYSTGFTNVQRRFAADSYRTNKNAWSLRLVAYKEEPNIKKEVSIIIPVFNALEEFKECLPSVLGYTEEECEIIIVDNGSKPDVEEFTREMREQDNRIIYVNYPHPLGFSKAVNAGISVAGSDYIVLLNSDTKILGENWIELLKKPMFEKENICITGPLMNHCDEINEDFLVFFCVMIRKSTFDVIGKLNTDFVVGGCEDIEFCHRVRDAGCKIVQVPDNNTKFNTDENRNTGTFPIYHKGEATVRNFLNWQKVFDGNKSKLISMINK